MDIKPVETGADYRRVLKDIEALMKAAPDTPEGETLDILATLVEAYERKQYPMKMLDPVEVIKLEME